MYSDSTLNNEINKNDDKSGSSRFSLIKQNFVAGVSYYIKINHYNTSGSVHARLSVKVPSGAQLQTITIDQPIDMDIEENEAGLFVFTPPRTGEYSIRTGYYGDNYNDEMGDTILYLYSDPLFQNELEMNDDIDTENNNYFSGLTLLLIGGTNYYIRIVGYGDSPFRARLKITGSPSKTDLDNDGIPDEQEIAGIRIGYQGTYVKTVVTDPNNPDTDGDGIEDGIELLEMKYYNSTGNFYEAIDDPSTNVIGTLANGVSFDIPSSFNLSSIDSSYLVSILPSVEQYKRNIKSYYDYVESYTSTLSSKGNDRLLTLSDRILESGLGYYFATTYIISNIQEFGTNEDRYWLATQTNNIEHLAAIENGIGMASTDDIEASAYDPYYFHRLGTRIHNEITKVFEMDLTRRYTSYSGKQIPGTVLKADLVYDLGRDEYVTVPDIRPNSALRAEIFEIKPITWSRQRDPVHYSQAQAQLNKYISKYQQYFTQKSVEHGKTTTWFRYGQIIIVTGTRYIARIVQDPTQPGMVYYQLINERTNYDETFLVFPYTVPTERPQVSVIYNNVPVQGQIVAREKEPDGSWGDYGVALLNVTGAVILVVGTVVEDVGTGGIGIADDPISFAVGAKLVQEAVKALRRAPAIWW
ncbi:hypothetical protein [Cohnella hongkongensis]|uniref:Uncharacterized protein n=1 Tax=Cohnella hongkongensis TaxID=178337 RepID=A0ABV9FLW0_9BACL